MSEQELREWLYRPKAIVPSNAGDENPFVGIWFRDLLECKKAIERDCVSKVCGWIREHIGEYVHRELEDCDMQYYGVVHTDMLVDDLKKEMEGLL